MPRMNSEVGRTSIDPKVQMKLWAISGGRCELCNRLLYQDLTLGVEGNFGEIAHIHAVSEGGPRYKYGMIREDKNNIENLMLLCEEHHHMIDTFPDDFKDGQLLRKKRSHESRIRSVTDIPDNETCRIVSYFSNIDHQEDFYSDRLFREAVLLLGKIPMQKPVINLNTDSNTRYNPSKSVFEQKSKDLEREFKEWFNEVIKSEDSIGVFALAPQPLLFKLGFLINDQYNTCAFQCHRSGHKWAWPKSENTVNFLFQQTAASKTNLVALVIDLSAVILDDRITAVLGEGVNIYHLTSNNPCRTFVTSERIQNDFVQAFRKSMEIIKNLRPAPSAIHIFPARPNSLAIKAGMDYMPKTDLPMLIYEQANSAEGFFETLTIGG